MYVTLASLHPRVLSGQVDSLAGLARGLKRQGHTVQLVAPFDTGQLLAKPLRSLDTGPTPLPQAARGMVSAVPRIITAARTSDILHLNLPTPAFSWVADLIQSRIDLPVVVNYEGHLAAASEALNFENLRREWRSWLLLWGVNNGMFGRLTRRSSAHYVVSTELQARELSELGLKSDRISVIPNIVDKAKLRRRSPSRARSQLKLHPTAPLIGYIGHFNQVKGVDVLARAFASMCDRQPDAQLVLAWSGQGNPDPIQTLLEPVADRVTWLGRVDTGLFLSAVDVLALPYRSTAGQAALPALVIEAIHQRRPMVTTALPLLEEVLSDGHNALLCTPGSPEALAEGLARLLTEPGLASRIAAGHVILSRRFTPEVLVQQYEQLYRTLLAGPVNEPAWKRAVA